MTHQFAEVSEVAVMFERLNVCAAEASKQVQKEKVDKRKQRKQRKRAREAADRKVDKKIGNMLGGLGARDDSGGEVAEVLATVTEGWQKVQSRSRPGEYTFVHSVTGERVGSSDPNWRPAPADPSPSTGSSGVVDDLER